MVPASRLGKGAEPPAAPSEAASGPPVSGAAPIPPLLVTALVVTKADLIAALRVYVPQLADVAPLDDDRFLLSLASATPEDDGRAS